MNKSNKPLSRQFPHEIAIMMGLFVAMCFLATPILSQDQMVYWSIDKDGCIASDKTAVECDFIVIDDVGYRSIVHRDRLIVITFAVDGDYLVADVLIGNEGKERFLLEPRKWAVFGYKEKANANAEKPLFRVYAEDSDKVAEKAENKGRWGRFFNSWAASLATTTATVDTTTTTNIGVTAETDGIVTGPDYSRRQQAATQNAESKRMAESKAESIRYMALKANTLFPDSRVAGRVYFKRGKAYYYEFYLRIADTIYTFDVTRRK